MDKIKELLKNKEKLKHYFLYLVFGVLATVVDFGTFYLLTKYLPSLDENISNFIAILVAIIFAYFTNRNYVFKSTITNKVNEFIKFFLSRMSSTLFNVVSFLLFTTFTKVNEFIIKVIISIIVVILNYIISKFYVFKEEK